jgi:hypothetical protein
VPGVTGDAGIDGMFCGCDSFAIIPAGLEIATVFPITGEEGPVEFVKVRFCICNGENGGGK